MRVPSAKPKVSQRNEIIMNNKRRFINFFVTLRPNSKKRTKMEKLLIGLCLFVLMADTSKISAQQQGEWQLIFSDEFNQPDGSRPDATKWSCPVRYHAQWNRWISNSPEVAFIKDGNLVCRAIPNTNKADTAKMLTGAVESRNKFSFQYGKVEVRMKTNMRVGNFPAAWMKPVQQNGPYGEIDIVEMFGSQGKAAHNIHTHRTYTLGKRDLKTSESVALSVKKWHIYGVEWDKDKVVWTIDGREVFRYNRLRTKKMQDEGQWTFDRPFFLLLNQSVGDGTFPVMIPNTRKTYETRFDWIRVYQRK